jgi:hypothetical protein
MYEALHDSIARGNPQYNHLEVEPVEGARDGARQRTVRNGGRLEHRDAQRRH